MQLTAKDTLTYHRKVVVGCIHRKYWGDSLSGVLEKAHTGQWVCVGIIFLKMKDLISDKAGREDLEYILILINGLPFF